MKLLILVVFSALVCCVFTGCIMYGAGISIRAKDARVPVCISETFYDSEYQIVTKDQYQVLYHFREDFEHTTFSIGCKSNKVEIGSCINDLITKYDGDAVVNVSVTGGSNRGKEALLTVPSLIVGLPTLGFFSFANVTAIVEGDVVKMLSEGQKSDVELKIKETVMEGLLRE